MRTIRPNRTTAPAPAPPAIAPMGRGTPLGSVVVADVDTPFVGVAVGVAIVVTGIVVVVMGSVVMATVVAIMVVGVADGCALVLVDIIKGGTDVVTSVEIDRINLSVTE